MKKILCLQQTRKQQRKCTKEIKQCAGNGQNHSSKNETIRQNGLCVQSLQTQTLKETDQYTTLLAGKLDKSPSSIQNDLKPVVHGGES